MNPYERLEAWKRAHDLALTVYRESTRSPSSERFGLTAQIRRAALSVPVNLVEGSAKFGNAEFRRFLDISLGSLAELAYLLRFARDVGVLEAADWRAPEEIRNRAGKMIWLLHRSLWRRKKSPPTA